MGNELAEDIVNERGKFDFLTETVSKCHTYDPLESSDHIRVMRLEPAVSLDATLCFSFITGTIRELQGQYEAVSYAWGKVMSTHRLRRTNSDVRTRATVNLDSALRRIRSENYVRTLWVDAVCINQQDCIEKSIQISRMREIYEAASAVIVWLGNDEKSEWAIHNLCNISRLDTTTSTNPYSVEDLVAILRTIRDNPYASRRWIIQEITSNSCITLYCGKEHISWSRFISAVETVDGCLKYTPSARNILQCYAAIISVWQVRAHGGLNSSRDISTPRNCILDLLDVFDYTDCIDPRDRLYAIYPLVTDVRGTLQPSTGTAQWSKIARELDRSQMHEEHRGEIILVVNYSLPHEVVYNEFAASAIISGYGLDILAAAALRKPHSQLKIPTWVPDWTQTRQPALTKRLRGQPSSLLISRETVTFDLPAYAFSKQSLPIISWHERSTPRSHFPGNSLPGGYAPLRCQVSLSWPDTTKSSTALCNMLYELDVTENHWHLLKELVISHSELETIIGDKGATSYRLVVHDSLSKCPMIFPGYSLFFAGSGIAHEEDNLDSQLPDLFFIGIANTAVLEDDRLLIPLQFNTDCTKNGEPVYFRALVLRDHEFDFSLVGFTFLIPLVAKLKEGEDGFGNEEVFFDSVHCTAWDFGPKNVTVRLS